MLATLRRMHRDERGFTLPELLVVVTILGILAATVTVSLIGLTSNAQSQACDAEKATVQTAMDAMMARNAISSVSAQASGVYDFSAKPTGSGATALYPNYLRSAETTGSYTWSTSGEVSQGACPHS